VIFNNLLIAVTFAAVLLILVSSNWRLRLAGLAIVDLLAFITILQVWPVALASVKLIAGWMGIILISASQVSRLEDTRTRTQNSLIIFRLMIVILVWIVISAEASAFNAWIPIPYTNLLVGLIIIAGGLVYASVNNVMFDVIIGLLTFLAGFDIIYSSLEGSALVTGIYALIVILISLLNSYFLLEKREISQ
jgi:hypothetical protein